MTAKHKKLRISSFGYWVSESDRRSSVQEMLAHLTFICVTFIVICNWFLSAPKEVKIAEVKIDRGQNKTEVKTSRRSKTMNCNLFKHIKIHMFYISSLCFLKWPAWKDTQSHWLHFYTFRFQMRPHNAWTIGQKIAPIAIMLLFSAVAFQGFPQGTLTRAQIVTLTAFVWLFSNVWFRMFLQLWPAG